MLRPTEAEIVEYERRVALRRARWQRKAPAVRAFFEYALWVGALSVGGLVVDLSLAMTYTADGQNGRAISGHDMLNGVPLLGTALYVGFVLAVWAIWHTPTVQKGRALRLAARERLAAQLGPEHPVRQFTVLHPYLAFFLKTILIFKVLELVFGPVTPRRK